MLDALIDRYAGGNKARFARALGITPQTLAGWYERGTMNKESIYATMAGVNPHWLLTDGEGNMTRGEMPAEKAAIVQDTASLMNLRTENAQLKERIADMKEHIQELKGRVADLREDLARIREQKNAATA